MTNTMTLALSELRSLITKAARGAGLGWGLAEEAGWAAEWLARRGLPAADWATLWLAARIDGHVSPVEVGAMLADDPVFGPLPDGLTAPGYLLPFLDRVAIGNGPVAITSKQGLVVQTGPDGQIAFGPCWDSRSNAWSFAASDVRTRNQDGAQRPGVSGPTLDYLDAMALRTTVPRSESSRRDAGSAAGDND